MVNIDFCNPNILIINDYSRTSEVTMKLNAYWKQVMDDLDKEHPEIKTNTFRNVYVGDREWLYDYGQIDTPDFEEEMERILDGVEPENDTVDYVEEIKLGEEMLKTLKEKERYIVEQHLSHNKSYAAIARDLKCTRQNIKYHYERIIKKLKARWT